MQPAAIPLFLPGEATRPAQLTMARVGCFAANCCSLMRSRPRSRPGRGGTRQNWPVICYLYIHDCGSCGAQAPDQRCEGHLLSSVFLLACTATRSAVNLTAGTSLNITSLHCYGYCRNKRVMLQVSREAGTRALIKQRSYLLITPCTLSHVTRHTSHWPPRDIVTAFILYLGSHFSSNIQRQHNGCSAS